MTISDESRSERLVIQDDDSYEGVEYLIPEGSPLRELIQKHIRLQSLHKSMYVTSLSHEDIGRTIRYNQDEEGVLEALEHEGEKVTHLTVSGKRLTSTDHYESVVILAKPVTREPSISA
jgi:hypothetical protein